MDVIAIIDRTIDGVARTAGEAFELPDDTDLIVKGVVRAANPVAEASAPVGDGQSRPIGWVGRERRREPVEDPATAVVAPRRTSERRGGSKK